MIHMTICQYALSTWGPVVIIYMISLAEWMAQKSPNFIFTTKMVFPTSLKFMNSGSEYMIVCAFHF